MSGMNPAIKACRLDLARLASIGAPLLLVTQLIPVLLVFLLGNVAFSTEICASAAVMNGLMVLINMFNYEQTGHHRLMNGLVPMNRRHQVTGRYLIVLGASLTTALTILVCAVLGDLLAGTPLDLRRIAMLMIAGVCLVWIGSAILAPMLYREGVAILAAMGVTMGLFFLLVIVLSVVERSGAGMSGFIRSVTDLAAYPAAMVVTLVVSAAVLWLSYRLSVRIRIGRQE